MLESNGLLRITERTLHDIAVLELTGHLTLAGNRQFKTVAATLIDAGARKLIINMARVDQMDGGGLGELITCYNRLQEVSGRFTLLQLNQRLLRLLALTKLDTVFEICATEAAAVASFAPRAERKVCGNENAACVSGFP
jgi:anti-anti-sigma factor